jgi:hypothetical protein
MSTTQGWEAMAMSMELKIGMDRHITIDPRPFLNIPLDKSYSNKRFTSC